MIVLLELLVLIVLPMLALSELIMLFSPFVRLEKRKDFPVVSVLVCARNEEKNIKNCIDSLLSQGYPNYEILVSDDHSTDQTAQILTQYESNSKVKLFYALDRILGVNPKTSQLIHLQKFSEGGIIMIADSDCIYESDWIEELSGRIGDGADIVSGITSVMGNKFQDIEWVTTLGRIALLPGRNGYAALGNNMAVRRAALEAVGGFEVAGGSHTEDMALSRIFRDHKFKIAFYTERSLVRTNSVPDKERADQRRRWSSGLRHVPVPLRFALILQQLALMFGVLSVIISPFWGLMGIFAFGLMRWMVDRRILVRLKKYNGIKEWCNYEIWRQFSSVVFVYFHFFRGSFTWKERKYEL